MAIPVQIIVFSLPAFGMTLYLAYNEGNPFVIASLLAFALLMPSFERIVELKISPSSLEATLQTARQMTENLLALQFFHTMNLWRWAPEDIAGSREKRRDQIVEEALKAGMSEQQIEKALQKEWYPMFKRDYRFYCLDFSEQQIDEEYHEELERLRKTPASVDIKPEVIKNFLEKIGKYEEKEEAFKNFEYYWRHHEHRKHAE